ncbi:hypothetical protein E2562_008133 [Oryza meyeriana var. granulata]|uniref:CCHC-type domain-containing protein n=1 Tax=Oryza meyeriana var. granulata TaxID=110450 RepID=A0A6G1CEG2_9ORYZ|nr:hypothetical protein E2562_008133 [Oryza meyeriana var. granulata]
MNEIRSLGTKVEETTIVEKLLHSVPDNVVPRRVQLLVAEAELRPTRAEWEAKVAEEKRSSEGSGSSGEKKKYHGKFDKSKIDCRNCSEFGHFADECPAVKKVVRGVAQLAMVDADDEPALL